MAHAVTKLLCAALPVTAHASPNSPPAPTASIHAPAGVAILWQEQRTTSHTVSIHFRFHTNRPLSGSDPSGAAQGFEAQLQQQGWEEVEADTSNNVFVSAWRWRSGERCSLLFSILQGASGGADYFGAIELVPSLRE